MAASLLLSAPSLNNNNNNNNRLGQWCLHMHSDHLQKGISCLSVCLKSQQNDIKLYMIPSRVFARNHLLRPFTRVGSSYVDVAFQGNRVSSGALASNNFQRSETSLDSSSNNGMNNFERELQELFNEVKTMIMMGNKNEAIYLLQANYEAVKEQMGAGARGIEEAAILDTIALGYMAVGDFKLVGSLLDMLNEIVGSLKDDEPLLDSVLIHMGSMYSTLGKFEKSMLMYRRVLGILESVYGPFPALNGSADRQKYGSILDPVSAISLMFSNSLKAANQQPNDKLERFSFVGKDSTFLITPLLGMAKVLGSIGRATKAVELYHRAITILESSRGVESEDLVLPLFALGNLLIKEGRAKDAENPFNRILDIYRKIYGENDGRVGMAMCSLAHAKCAKGNADEAVYLYKNALQILKDSKYIALDDSIMEKMRIDLAELLHAVGRGKEGRELLEECLLITEKYKGKEHPSSVTHLLNLATSYSHSKNFVEAERLLRTSLRIMMKTLEPDDPSITFPMLHLAVTLFHLKQDEEAEQLALEVLRIREGAFGKESLPVGEALDCLVSIQTRLGKDDSELLDLLKRVLRIQEKEIGCESEEVMVTLKKIVFYLDKMGRRDEKQLLHKRLSMLRTKYKQMVQY